MGYRISSLASLPVIPGIDLYVFALLKHFWEEGPSAELENNFHKLAKNLGPKAAIVMGHEGNDLTNELYSCLRNLPVIHQLLDHADMKGPSILILGAHPNEMTADDLLLYANAAEIEERFGGLSYFFGALSDFASGRDSSFIKIFEAKENSLANVLDVVDLKPNFFGIGFNGNAFIEKVMKRRRG
jgi:hypothetical protein